MISFCLSELSVMNSDYPIHDVMTYDYVGFPKKEYIFIYLKVNKEKKRQLDGKQINSKPKFNIIDNLIELLYYL